MHPPAPLWLAWQGPPRDPIEVWHFEMGFSGDWREQKIAALLDSCVRARLDELSLPLISYAGLKLCS